MRFEGGREVTPHRRERPHVLLAADGRTVEAITTGVQERPPPEDRTWTMVQPVKAKGSP